MSQAADTLTSRRRENRRYLNFVASLFERADARPTHLRTSFAAMHDHRVMVVIARVDTSKADDLRHLVENDWGGYFDTPVPL